MEAGKSIRERSSINIATTNRVREVMALIICTECAKEFSDKAACPFCGCPTTESIIGDKKYIEILLQQIRVLVVC